jgi:uncharacterized damage-inducible protein DinB
MIAPEYCQLLARYGHWMNERLCALLSEFADEERKRDRGAFFGSMHGTLNHLLWGDRVWLGRFIGEDYAHPAFGRDMYADFDALRRERDITDTRILEWAGHVTPEWLGGELVYTSAADGKVRTLARAVAVVHFFNHATHHRGQLTTLIRQAGRDPGHTDLPWLPGLARITGDSG